MCIHSKTLLATNRLFPIWLAIHDTESAARFTAKGACAGGEPARSRGPDEQASEYHERSGGDTAVFLRIKKPRHLRIGTERP